MSDKELEFRSRLLSGALRMREGGFDATADILESLLREEIWKARTGQDVLIQHPDQNGVAA